MRSDTDTSKMPASKYGGYIDIFRFAEYRQEQLKDPSKHPCISRHKPVITRLGLHPLSPVIAAFQTSSMGVCKPGYTSIHSLLQGDFNDCTINHTSEQENQFWVLTFPLQPGYERKADELEIGRIKNVRKTIRLTREMTWWLSTRQDNGTALPRDHDTVCLLAMLETDTPRSTKHLRYICFIPLISHEIVGTLRGEKDILLARFEHESFDWRYGQIIVSLGPKPISLLRATVAFQQRYDQPPSPPIYTDKSEELYRGRLTYCTWNSLQDPVPRTATSMMRTLESFPVVPNNLLIDDGWQMTTGDRQMSGYGAQEYWLDGYKSLGDVISNAKKMGVERVGVWHTVLGYWGGISRSSETFKYVPFLTLRKNWGATYSIIHPLQVDRFFDTWYKQLSDWGVDFVKCDDMAEIEDMDSCTDDNGTPFPLRTVRTAYVTAIKRNVQRYFNGRIIWCMSQSPRHLLGPYALSSTKDIKPMRSSNDYFPDIPSSHAYHIYTNTFVSQFQSCFSVSDFDMFQTHHFLGSSSTVAAQGPFHASLRALGNGPVTVTDVAGHCDESVFMRLVGRTRDGKTTALNAESPIEISDERCFDEVAEKGDGKGLRGYSKSEWGVIMGIWNVRDNGGWVKDTMSLDDVEIMLKSKDMVCWSHARQEVFLPQKDTTKEVVLKELEFDVFTMVEMTTDVMCLGLIDKYNTLAAIHSQKGKTWTFKCLGEAMWVVVGHPRVTVKVEGMSISSLSWTIGDLTAVRASLTDFKEEVQSVNKIHWEVEIVLH